MREVCVQKIVRVFEGMKPKTEVPVDPTVWCRAITRMD